MQHITLKQANIALTVINFPEIYCEGYWENKVQLIEIRGFSVQNCNI